MKRLYKKDLNILKGFAPETILTAIPFFMIGYFNGHEKTLWVMIQGLIQTLLVRLTPCIFYEYTAGCQPYQYRACSACCHMLRNYIKYNLFPSHDKKNEKGMRE